MALTGYPSLCLAGFMDYITLSAQFIIWFAWRPLKSMLWTFDTTVYAPSSMLQSENPVYMWLLYGI